MPIRPDRLNPGDTIGIVSPASPPPDPGNIDRAVTVLEQLGYETRIGSNVRKRRGFLAGDDRERAGDLMKMFADSRVKAIMCVRGGYGAGRILPRLDYRLIRANAKIFVGYSDITALNCAFLVKANLVNFHGPMLNSDILRSSFQDFALRSFLKVLGQPAAAGSVCAGDSAATVGVLRRGRASGPLLGGNLSLLCSLLGTPYQPNFDGRILFFEDVEEAPYRVDRMLTQLLNAGLLQQVAGIAIGVNVNCKDPKSTQGRESRQTIEDVLRERLRPLHVPVLVGLPFGHVAPNATLPIGVRATLDANRGDLAVTEPAVQ
jgi:muramoyltetrapeptide carboxypeptidase